MRAGSRIDSLLTGRLSGALFAAFLFSAIGCDPQSMSNEAFANSSLEPLAQAVASGDSAEIKRQLASVDPNTPGADGATLLVAAIGAEKLAATQALLDGGADPNQPGGGGETPVHTAAFVGDPAFLNAVLAHGGDPNVRNPATASTPLSRALRGLHLDNVRILLDAGADPQLGDNNGDRPLHVAARTNAGAAILMLLEAGADPLATNSGGASFQAYYFSYPPRNALNERALAERREVVAWLKAHQVPLEANVDPDY